MKIKCPYCSSCFEIAGANAGQMVRCPVCSSSVAAENPNLTPCPDCFEQISRRAAVCPRCGAVLGNTASVAQAVPLDITEETKAVYHPAWLGEPGTLLLGIVTAPFVIGLFVLLGLWFKIHFTSYEITNLRIICRSGFIARQQNEVRISDIRGANFSQTFCQRIFNVGNISIGTAATAGTEICMQGISSPDEVINLINEQRKASSR